MPDNVTEISDASNDSRQISPERLLRATMHEVQDNPDKWNKCLVILVNDDKPDHYYYGYRNSQLNCKDLVAVTKLVGDDASELLRHNGEDEG